MNKPGVILGGLACLLAALLLAGACGGLDKQDPLTRKERSWLEEHGPVKVASDETYHPFAYLGSGGQPEGICVDVWKAMAAKLGFEVQFLTMDDAKELAGLRSGALDSSTGMFPLSDRRQYLDFSEPFYPISTAIFINTHGKGAQSLEDLRGLRVGAVKGDSGAALLVKNNFAPVLYDTYRECVEALGQARVDAVVMDDPVMLYWRRRLNLGDDISWAPGNAVVERNDLALPVHKGNQVLLGIINKGLALVSGAEMQHLRERYVP